MKSEIENSIGGEMKEMKERLDTLTATLEENKDEGQLWFQNIKNVYNYWQVRHKRSTKNTLKISLRLSCWNGTVIVALHYFSTKTLLLFCLQISVPDLTNAYNVRFYVFCILRKTTPVLSNIVSVLMFLVKI